MSGRTIRVKSMLGTSHSWSVTMRSLVQAFINHEASLYLESINGYDLFPNSWQSLKRSIMAPDIDIAYTLPRNFNQRFNAKSKLKMAVYNYETSILPSVWRKAHEHVDYILPSSNFSKKVFLDAGWPDEKCIVIPHGIWPDEYVRTDKVKNLKTNKSFKFLNVSIPHYRKNIKLLLDAYYSEFCEEEDVCLILKTSLSAPKNRFECNVKKEIIKAQRGHLNKKLPQVEVLTHRYESLVPLYNTCDCLISATSSEGFGLPLLEGMASGMLVAAPHVTGQADFLNVKNSLAIDAKKIDAPPNYQYWRPSPGAKMYMPYKESLQSVMRKAFENKHELTNDFRDGVKSTLNEYTWMKAASKILSI